VHATVHILETANSIVYSLLAITAIFAWVRTRGPARAWLALTFTSLAIVLLRGRVLPEGIRQTRSADVASTTLLILFPWLLYRFTSAFGAPRRLMDGLLLALAAATCVATVVLPVGSDGRTADPHWLGPYLLLFVAEWIALLASASRRLLTARRGQPTIMRRRLSLLGIGSLGMGAAIITAGITANSPNTLPALTVATHLLATLSALMFFCGFFTPRSLRILWRHPEQEKMSSGIAQLLTVTDVEQLQERLLPQMAHLVSARGIAFISHDGAVLSLHGVNREDAANAWQRFGDPQARAVKREMLASGRSRSANPILPMDFDFGVLMLWINPYLPFFGPEELDLMRSLAVIYSLALQRIEALEAAKERADQLTQISKLKDEFVAMASHELRTPLASILGFSQTLLDMPERLTSEQRAEFIEIINKQGLRLQRLIEDMLTLSRIESGALKSQIERVPVCEAVNRAVHALSASQIDVHCDAELAVMADPHHLHQILVNYLTNAERYGGEDVCVEARCEGDQVAISVLDRGPGVPASFAPELFERFTQAPDSVGKGGTGLGLAIVRQMARAQGGDASYAPREGGGSAFTVSLPASEPDAAT
jgi:signal transduction histidine kinase